ncbi:MAG: hypothetical protein MSG64_13970 [Pyrinomonadaceae bacterium MAG19_C2-C3]|nr:hypothetical protein [Pyrinomonadaceae bacterium MAG19_C2-C3]
MKTYPDITEILEQKKNHRRALASLTFEQKIALVFKLQERRRFIKSGQVVEASAQTENKAGLSE